MLVSVWKERWMLSPYILSVLNTAMLMYECMNGRYDWTPSPKKHPLNIYSVYALNISLKLPLFPSPAVTHTIR